MMQLKLTETPRHEFISFSNFYEDPDEVREHALSLQYKCNLNYHKGARSLDKYAPDEIKDKFEQLLNKKIYNWDCESYPNGVFQYCTGEDPIVYHMDRQSYAAAIYLTPDAPPECGTSFFRSKRTKHRRDPGDRDTISQIFNTGFFDRTQFELIDTVGNVYNRLVMWDSKLIHAASQYFGNSKENSRLFHLFFFDIEQ
jgi:hypothetical protein